jgi:hypothetical protein
MENQLAKQQELLPILPSGAVATPRYHCPFYGFHLSEGTAMTDQKGNQCALQTGRYSPCRMERAGEVPDWDHCPISREFSMGFFREMGIIAFPEEFWPAGHPSWEGIPFNQWEHYVMNAQTPRPSTKKDPPREIPA